MGVDVAQQTKCPNANCPENVTVGASVVHTFILPPKAQRWRKCGEKKC